MLRPVRTVAPAADLLDLAAVKLHLKLEAGDTTEDSLVSALIGAVTAHLDGYAGILGRCLVNQTWRQDFEGFPSCLRLPFPDVSSVTLKYYDAVNVQQTVSSANYQLLEDERGSFVELNSSYAVPSVYQYRADPVSVTMVAGFGAAATSVPGSVIAAALMLIGNLYANREATLVGQMVEVPLGVRALLAPVSRKAF